MKPVTNPAAAALDAPERPVTVTVTVCDQHRQPSPDQAARLRRYLAKHISRAWMRPSWPLWTRPRRPGGPVQRRDASMICFARSATWPDTACSVSSRLRIAYTLRPVVVRMRLVDFLHAHLVRLAGVKGLPVVR